MFAGFFYSMLGFITPGHAYTLGLGIYYLQFRVTVFKPRINVETHYYLPGLLPSY
ncbi:MAG: hypothetical protein ACI9WS_001610 [Paraglaciecola psychrophila]|jgi:hypothetical protein